MEHTLCHFEVKTDTDNTGYIAGYGSTCGNINSYKDIFAHGAFAASLSG
jgi:hypothetical protein